MLYKGLHSAARSFVTGLGYRSVSAYLTGSPSYYYSRNAMLSLRNRSPISSALVNTLKDLNIFGSVSRGCRAGRRVANRKIRVINNRAHSLSVSSCGVNSSNLASFPRNIIPTRAPSRFALWNARSLKKKSHHLCDFIIEHKVDIMAVTETWFTGDERDNFALRNIANTLPHYTTYSFPRSSRGGGVLILIKSSFDVQLYDTSSFQALEYIELSVSTPGSGTALR